MLLNAVHPNSVTNSDCVLSVADVAFIVSQLAADSELVTGSKSLDIREISREISGTKTNVRNKAEVKTSFELNQFVSGILSEKDDFFVRNTLINNDGVESIADALYLHHSKVLSAWTRKSLRLIRNNGSQRIRSEIVSRKSSATVFHF